VSNRVRAAVICLVACVWTANFVAPIFVKGYVPSAEVHMVFLTVLAILGLGYQRNTGGPESTEQHPEVAEDSQKSSETVPQLTDKPHGQQAGANPGRDQPTERHR